MFHFFLIVFCFFFFSGHTFLEDRKDTLYFEDPIAIDVGKDGTLFFSLDPCEGAPLYKVSLSENDLNVIDRIFKGREERIAYEVMKGKHLYWQCKEANFQCIVLMMRAGIIDNHIILIQR